MKYKLLTISILSGVFLSGQDALAAKYQVTEITPLEQYRQHFAMDISDNGQVLGVVRDSFNFPFYLEDYITGLGTGGISCDVSEEEQSSGNFDAFSSSCIRTALTSRTIAANATYQKVGDNKSFVSNAGRAELVNLVDVFDSELNSFTNSNTEHLRSINEQGIAVGRATAPFTPIMFTQTGENATSSEEMRMWQRDYNSRAVVYINGEVRTIEPDFTTYGGESEAIDISNQGYVAGLTSVSMAQQTIDDIEKDCIGELSPEAVCVWRKSLSGRLYESRPVVWKLDTNGNVESKQLFDLAFVPTDEQTDNYFATATAVNDSGLAAGYGNVPRSENVILVQPLYYQGSETKTFVDNDVYDRGFSTDINNSGVIVGTVQKFFDRVYNSEFFVYNINTGEFTTPATFYETAESNAYGINDAGKVVGEAEYEVTTDTIRRKHGFLYDSVSKEFFDLNDLTECGSPYEIIETRSINNSDQIVATALKTVDRRDSLGEVVTDDDGNVRKEEVAVTVLLNPIAGEIDDCTEVEDPPIERKGSTNSIALSLGLLFVAVFRRRIF